VDKKDFIYVVKIGRTPGIYYSEQNMLLQVIKFQGAMVGKFTNIERAKAYLAKPVKEVKEISEEERAINKALKKQRNIKHQERKKQYNIKLELKNAGNILCFLDCEADKDIAISLGAVIIDDLTNEVIDTFYSTIKPKNFKKVSYFIRKLTGLTDEVIMNSESFDEIYIKFESFLKEHNVTDIFSWGNSDYKFLKKSTEKDLGVLKNIKNIQTYISMITSDIIYNAAWSLQNIKSIFNIPSDVMHNAFSDAVDLCNVYIKWKTKDINIEEIKRVG